MTTIELTLRMMVFVIVLEMLSVAGPFFQLLRIGIASSVVCLVALWFRVSNLAMRFAVVCVLALLANLFGGNLNPNSDRPPAVGRQETTKQPIPTM
jgi:hypothetical protein